MIVVIATIYDGFMTCEAKMAEIYDKAVLVAAGLGGYVCRGRD